MNAIKVKKTELIEKLKENRAAHRGLFLKAQEGYRAQVITELDAMLREAREGKKIRRAVQLPEPLDRTEDYDQLIGMLEMDVTETVELTAHDFAQYVLDKWEWQSLVSGTNARYI